METLIIYQIPRSIMHDRLPHHVGHHFVTIQALFAPTQFTRFLPLYAQLPPLFGHGLLLLFSPTELAPPLQSLLSNTNV